MCAARSSNSWSGDRPSSMRSTLDSVTAMRPAPMSTSIMPALRLTIRPDSCPPLFR